MQFFVEHNGKQYRCNSRDAKSLAINLDFEGPQPNHFGTARANRSVLKLGEFVGDTESGGSCNVDVLQMIPHCNGTHTETISHIVNEDFWIGHAAIESLSIAYLVTVKPVPVERLAAAERQDVYRPPLDPNDLVITRAMLERAIQALDQWRDAQPQALLIRTLPNDDAKRSRAYGEKFSPPFLTVDAMELIVELDVRHLLVDFPSVDRMYDDGLLTNHHLFWNVAEGTHEVSADARQDRTITEMIFVEEQIRDGVCVLNLQIPAFGTDAAPSRPVLFPVKRS